MRLAILGPTRPGAHSPGGFAGAPSRKTRRLTSERRVARQTTSREIWYCFAKISTLPAPYLKFPRGGQSSAYGAGSFPQWRGVETIRYGLSEGREVRDDGERATKCLRRVIHERRRTK
jgi:hypothetical protein